MTLTVRESDTLRLLLRGYDAKSIARHLNLSVHTINERLRDARRKLGVASSREAVRLLAEAERADPELVRDNVLGVIPAIMDVLPTTPSGHRQSAMHRLAWLSGGMLTMSLVIAAAALVSVVHGSTASGPQSAGSSVVTTEASASRSQGMARRWLILLDRQNWDASWRAAASVFQSQISAPQWAATIRAVRSPLGAVSSRTFQSATKTGSLPGVPSGDYEVVQFQTDFAHKSNAVETVTLSHQNDGWRVAGYFIR